jgi:hypothetical protein
VSKGVIFQELLVAGGNIIQLFPFVCALYAFDFPMFHNHHNHENNVTIIPSTMETHQGDLLGKTLLALAHFKALCFIVTFLFISIHYK